jgi:uncharacterized membrane protein YhaH (DUF805 family)
LTFSDAIRSGFEHYTDFDGRASRAAYWWWFLFALLASVAAGILDAALDTAPLLRVLVGLALFLPGLSVAIRRLHDTDRSGWWVLIGLIPIIGWIVLLIWYLQQGDATENRFGPPPAESTAPATA